MDTLCQRFNDIVEVRYRQRGYRVGWLMFSSPDDQQTPDLSRVAKEFILTPDDQIITAGIDFKLDTSKVEG